MCIQFCVPVHPVAYREF